MKTRLFWLTLTIITAVTVLAFGARKEAPSVPSKLVVHEWGTFTSVFGSDGAMLTGLEVDEEELPYFVYSLDASRGMPQFGFEPAHGNPVPRFLFAKGLERPLRNVTVKMETPVIYFYSEEEVDARVSVGFKGGSIGQWYPKRSGGEIPKPVIFNKDRSVKQGLVDFAKDYRGSVEWNFRVKPRTEHTDFQVMKEGETATWLHPRLAKSSLLETASGETETYLFYRGLGNFNVPIDFRVSDGQLHIEQSSRVPYLLVYERQGMNARILWKGKPEELTSVDLGGAPTEPFKDNKVEIYQSLQGALVEAGLYQDEADAMLRTWWHSYFSKPGLRVFWVVPRQFTDTILPIEVEPRPTQLERVLLGRSEILTPNFEQHLIDEFTGPPDKNWFRSDRYHRAYAQRVKQLTELAGD